MHDIHVRFWASARAAAGAAEESVPVDGPVILSDLVTLLTARREDGDRLASVLAVCSVLVGDRPVGRRDRATVSVEPGSSVEFLPPFAGG